MHFTGVMSAGFLVYYFVLLVTSAQHDKFNWLIILWCFAIGLPRVILYFMIFNDSIYRRRLHATCLVATTALQILFFIVDQFEIFMHSQNFCNRVYAVYYMMDDWGVACEWSIVMYEICMLSALAFYIYASKCAVGYFHLGFDQHRLRVKEVDRLN